MHMKDICLVYASALNGLLYKLCRRWIIITHCYVITLINDDWTVGDRYRGRLVPRLVYVLYYKPSLVSGSPSSFFCFCKLLRCFFFPMQWKSYWLHSLCTPTHSSLRFKIAPWCHTRKTECKCGKFCSPVTNYIHHHLCHSPLPIHR